jgi:hypothetical protein
MKKYKKKMYLFLKTPRKKTRKKRNKMPTKQRYYPENADKTTILP